VLVCGTHDEGDRPWDDSATFEAAFTTGFREADPRFAFDSEAGSFALSPDSPAVNAGSGEDDPDGSPADIGAFGGPDGNWFLEYPWQLD